MVSIENPGYLKPNGRTHLTWTVELPLNLRCLDSSHDNILRRQQMNRSRFLATVSERGSDIGDLTTVGCLMAALQVRSRIRGEGTQEVSNERHHRYSHLPTIRLSAPVGISLQFAGLGYDEDDAGIGSSTSSAAASTNRSVTRLYSEGGGRASHHRVWGRAALPIKN